MLIFVVCLQSEKLGKLVGSASTEILLRFLTRQLAINKFNETSENEFRAKTELEKQRLASENPIRGLDHSWMTHKYRGQFTPRARLEQEAQRGRFLESLPNEPWVPQISRMREEFDSALAVTRKNEKPSFEPQFTIKHVLMIWSPLNYRVNARTSGVRVPSLSYSESAAFRRNEQASLGKECFFNPE